MAVQRVTPSGFVNETGTLARVAPFGFINETTGGAAPPSTTAYYPGSDVSNAGAWTASSGSALYAMLDEVTPSDADYIRSPINPSAAACVIAFADVQTPGSNTLHSVSYRAAADSSATLKVELLGGDGSVIVTWTHTTLTSAYQLFTQNLTTGQADALAAAGYPGCALRLTANY